MWTGACTHTQHPTRHRPCSPNHDLGVGSMAFPHVSTIFCETLSHDLILITVVVNIRRRAAGPPRFRPLPTLAASPATTTAYEIDSYDKVSPKVVESPGAWVAASSRARGIRRCSAGAMDGGAVPRRELPSDSACSTDTKAPHERAPREGRESARGLEEALLGQVLGGG